METILLVLLLLISIGILSLLVLSFIKRPKGFEGMDGIINELKRELDNHEKTFKTLFENQLSVYKQFNELLSTSVSNYNNDILNRINNVTNNQANQLVTIENRLNEILKNNNERLDKIIDTISQNLNSLQENNEKKLEQMRQTVDEKLSSTLEKRLSESVKIITNGIDTVSKGLGEMQNIASGMGDLKRVLTNVKTRGGWGEVQLGTLLEQILSPNQYASQVMIKQNTIERVDFVINMPGKNNDTIMLPIDAKFPLEDYSRLCTASEEGNKDEVEIQSKNIEKRIKEEAKKICEKYIDVPKTTDFAVLYLPVEGLYAEVTRRPALVETLQQQYRILICGPSTLTALLNSLQMGFKTLAIEKRSSEIWQLLGVFKQEFSKFVELLGKTQKKIDEASNTIEDATKKTKTIQRKLKDVVDIDGPKETNLLENFIDSND